MPQRSSVNRRGNDPDGNSGRVIGVGPAKGFTANAKAVSGMDRVGPARNLDIVFESFDKIIVVEEGSLVGGVGETIRHLRDESGYTNPLKALAFPDEFVTHGNKRKLLNSIGLDALSIQEFLELS